jgi:hypothetical protein
MNHENPEKLANLKRSVKEISHEVATLADEVSEEGDRWFLATWHGIDVVRIRTGAGFSRLSEALVARLPRGPWSRKSPRERLERALEREAKRQRIDVGTPEFVEFSAKMASVLELVITGQIPFDAIGFESEAEAPVADSPEQSAVERQVSPAELMLGVDARFESVSLFELGEEVTNYQQGYQPVE